MSETCPRCGHHGLADDRFCGACGMPMDADAHDFTGSHTSIIPTASTGSGGMPAVGSGHSHEIPADGAILVVHRGPGEGTTFELAADADVLAVGRAPESDIFLDDVTVSRRHAEFRRGAEGWSVRDSGSLNGTYVNRQRVDDQRLHPGDEVQVGKFRFVFLVGEASTR